MKLNKLIVDFLAQVIVFLSDMNFADHSKIRGKRERENMSTQPKRAAALTVLALIMAFSFAPKSHAYMAAIECSVVMTIPSCDMEVPPEYVTSYGESDYNGVDCEQKARQYCGSQVQCPNGNSGYTDYITCGHTSWH